MEGTLGQSATVRVINLSEGTISTVSENDPRISELMTKANASLNRNRKPKPMFGGQAKQTDQELKSSDTIVDNAVLIINPSPKWSLMDIIIQAPPPGWTQVFKKSLPELEDIVSILEDQARTGQTYFPYNCNIFRAFQYCPLNNVKIVIIGQDPYHSTDHRGNPIANGLAFSVARGNSIPSSLRNIYKEIASNIPGFIPPDHGDLTDWSRQGILLLNTCLTVKPHQAASHKQIWMGFIQSVIEEVNQRHPNCIYVLWGRKAQRIENMIRGKANILKAAHPSGLSANRGFFGCEHFSRINQMLIKMGKAPIDWQL